MPPNQQASNRAKEIFLHALDRDDPEERATFLREACAGDKALSKNVLTLLGEQERMEGEFLESPAVTPGMGTTLPASSLYENGFDGATGEHIGRYKLLETIGEGGSGVVYLAEQQEPVRRRVALKILKLGMDTKSVIARFESERQALAMMDHPNIARVFDAGATERGRPYFVMELVRGMPMTAYCEAAKLSVNERISLFILACQAMQHAHQKGIIHRDLKPSNILVALRDGEAVPKIIDFGVAKATEQRLTDKTLYTHMQTFIGTPAYMSPEQAELGALDIDTRCDIYALGVLLYELLVGTTPFDAKILEKVGLDEFRRTIREDVPARPSARLLQDPDSATNHCITAREVGNDLDWIVMKCIEKDRHRRYATVNDLALDLDHYMTGETVAARPPTLAYRTGKLFRRHRAGFAVVAALIIVMLAGVIVSRYQALRATKAEKEARAAQITQSELRARAEIDRENAVESAARARLNEYVADINIAHLSLADGNIAKAAELLDKHLPVSGESDLRGFEWRYLMELCQGDEHISLPRQAGPVTAIAFSPDGESLATGTREELRIWDINTLTEVATLPGGATSLAFLSDGKTLIAASSGGVWVLNATDWSDAKELAPTSDAFAVSANGSRVATAGRRGVRIWDTNGWLELRHPRDASGPLAFSPDGETLATNSLDGIKLWSISGNRSTVILKNSPRLLGSFSQGANMIAFSPDGQTVIAPHNTKSESRIFYFSIWDAKSGEEIATIPQDLDRSAHTGFISNVGFGDKGRFLATGSWDHSIRLWDYESHRPMTELRGHRGEVWALAVSPDGKVVASGSKDGEIKLWPTNNKDERLQNISGHWTPLAFSADGRQVAARNRQNKLTFFDLASRQEIRSLALDAISDPTGHKHTVSLSADTTILAECLTDGTVKITNTVTHQSQSMKAMEQAAKSVVLSPDGRSMLVRARRGPIVWRSVDDKSGESFAKFDAERAFFSEDGSSLAVLSDERPVEIWDTATRSLRARILQSGQSGGSQAQLSPDGRVLAMTRGIEDFENTVTLWDTTTGEPLGTCTGHKQAISSIAFSPEGRTLATSSRDSTIKFWNVETRQELLSVRRLGATLTNLQFSPEGQYLVGGSTPSLETGELHIFHAPVIESSGRN